MTQFYTWSQTPLNSVLITMTPQHLQTSCYERGKTHKNQTVYCKYFAWQLLSCCWEVVKFEERGGEIIYNDNTYCCGRHFFCKFWEQSQEPLLKWYQKCIQYFSSQQVQFQKTEGLQVFRTHFHHLCVKEEEVSLCWFCSHQSTKGERKTHQLSILAQSTVHIINQVTWNIEVYGIQHQTLH